MNYLSFHPLYAINIQNRITFFEKKLKKIFYCYLTLIISSL